MRTILPAAATVIVAAWGGAALADDHLSHALAHRLSEDSQPFQTNPAGHSGEGVPGQGDPKDGEDLKTPATDTEAANEHAQVKPRG